MANGFEPKVKDLSEKAKAQETAGGTAAILISSLKHSRETMAGALKDFRDKINSAKYVESEIK